MYKLKIHKKAKETLDFLKEKQSKDLLNIIVSLDEIGEKGLKAINIKNIGDSVFRKRVGRWRILFTIDKIFDIWIIELEKDTKKDYKKWKDYIFKNI